MKGPSSLTFKFVLLLVASLEVCSLIAVSQDAPNQSSGLKVRPDHDRARSWVPPDVNSIIPPVEEGVPCSTAEVLQNAQRRAEELVDNLPKFAATETMQHYELHKSGKWMGPQTVTFDYMAEMNRVRPDMLVMEETRDGRIPLEKFPAHFATLGLPIMALIFHPVFSGEYEMQCEGLGQWEGRPAWQVYFYQRADKVPRLRAYSSGDKSYRLKLRGRAWLDSRTYHPLRIETDLIQPIPEIELLREHLAVTYRPVHFQQQNEDLWLQQSAEVFMDFHGHRYRRVHTFSNFLLFAVDVTSKDAAPKER